MSKGKGSRRIRRALAGVAALLVAVAVGWFSGWPQERLLEWQFEKNTGAVAVVQWGGAGSDFRFKRVEIYPDRAARRDGRPLLVAEDITVGYALFPDDARRLKLIEVKRATITLDISDPASPNYAFLTKSAGQGGDNAASADTQFIPRDISIDELQLAVATAQGRAALSPIQLSLDLTDPDAPAIQYRSGLAAFVWESVDGETVELKNATLDGSLGLEDDRLRLSQTFDAPGLAYSVITGDGDLSGETPQVNVIVNEFTLAGNRLAGFLDAFDAPVRFDEFDIESGDAQIALSDPPQFRVRGVARVRATSLLGSAQPIYADVARIELEADQAESFAAHATLTLAKNQVVHAEFSGDDRSGVATVTSERWTREQLLDALPEAFRAGVRGLGFDSFLTTANLEWTEDGFTASVNASSQGGGAATPPIRWVVDARGPRDTLAGIEGALEARIGERAIHATARYIGNDEYHAEARIEEVQLAPWVQLFAGDETAERVGGTIEGTLLAHAIGKDAPIELTPNLHLRSFVYNDVDLDEITVGGAVRFDVANEELIVTDLRAEAIDGMTMVALKEFSYDAAAARGEGTFAAGANLGILGAALGLPELFGSGTAEGRIEIDGSSVVVASSIFSDYMGYEDILLPFREKITGDIVLSLDTGSGAGEVTECVAQVTEGTTVRLVNTVFTLDPLDVTGGLECDSDMRIAVAMGWLDAVEGSLTERTSFRVTDEGWTADWRLETTLASLQLPANAGSALDAHFEGSGTYSDGLAGSGTVRASTLTAAGGGVSNAQGPVTFSADTMHIRPARGTLFGGEIVAEIDVGVLVEGLPIELTGSFDRIDLAILSDEVKPPNTTLTGTAAGTVTARYTSAGLETFSLNASAPRGLSVNRSLVSDLLQSDKFLAGVGERVAGRAMDKLLGTQPQRPFDSGRLNVGLDGAKIVGTAELLSVKTEDYNGLNLTVNLDMDQSALAEALRLLEESKLGNVDF